MGVVSVETEDETTVEVVAAIKGDQKPNALKKQKMPNAAAGRRIVAEVLPILALLR